MARTVMTRTADTAAVAEPAAAAPPVADSPVPDFTGPEFTGAALLDRLPVTFSGDGSGVEELSWGQFEIWMAIVRQHSSLPLGGVKPLPPGTTVQEIGDELRYLMSRYQSLRTRIRFDAHGRPTQELFGSGEIGLAIYEAGAAAEPKAVAEAVNEKWTKTAFDYADEWPVRMAVVTKDGDPAYMVVSSCHLALDGGGAEVMAREVATRQTTPIAGLQPMDQARWQRSPQGRRQDAAAQRYWERTLRALPAQRGAGETDPRRPRYWSGQLYSRALRPAVHAAAQCTATDSSAVLLAYYAIALGLVAGTNPVAILSVVGNRFRPGLADVVCPAAQSGLCVVDVADVTVGEAIERARRAAVLGLKYCYRDPEPLPALIERVNRERGTDLDIDRYFNDRRGADDSKPPGPPVTPRQLSDAAAESSFRWIAPRDIPFERLFLHVDNVADGLGLLVEGDTHHYSPAQIEALARTIEATAIRAAFDPALPTGVSTCRAPEDG